MKTLKSILGLVLTGSAFLVLVAIVATPAVKAADKGGQIIDEAHIAQPQHNFSGCYAGGGFGMTFGNMAISASPLSFNGVASDGTSWNLRVGCDMQLNRTLAIGVFGDYAWHDVGTPSTFGETTLKADVDSSWAIGARVGYIVADRSMIYATLGFTEFAMGGISGIGPGIDLANTDGMFVGAGGEFLIAPNVSLTGEYRYSMLDDVAIGGVNLEADVHEVRLGVNYRFNLGRTLLE